MAAMVENGAAYPHDEEVSNRERGDRDAGVLML
jgi:hypothetical protein